MKNLGNTEFEANLQLSSTKGRDRKMEQSSHKEVRRANFDPYEGDENYIFISYSHENSDKVIPVLEMLNAKGFRIWYDKGISVGNRHQTIIAEHISRCSVFMAFHSKESVKSDFCPNEINWAIKKKKTNVSVYLEKDVELVPRFVHN